MTSCADCPDLDPASMPKDWVPRPTCCRDDHIERRLNGSFEPWEGIEKGRQTSDQEEAHKSRQQRRYEARKGRR